MAVRWLKPNFQIGDATDTSLCVSLKHEFLRCDDAFNDFAASATTMIRLGEGRRIAYKTYNAYARFIHHLYEFYMGAAARDFRNADQLSAETAERYVASQTQRILTNRREAILNGTAPIWENHISHFPENIPPSFPAEFRRLRNVASGHVSIKRSKLSLTEFYDKHHKYVHMLYLEAKNWWGTRTRGVSRPR